MWLDADFLALVGCIEFIVVAQTAAVDELLALLCFVIVEISVGSSMTSADRPRQITAIYRQKTNTAVTIILLFNSISEP